MTTSQTNSSISIMRALSTIIFALSIGGTLAALPSILKFFFDYENIPFLVTGQIIGSILLLVSILPTSDLVHDDNPLRVTMAEFVLSGVVIGVSFFLVQQNMKYHWAFFTAALCGIVLFITAGKILVSRVRAYRKLTPLERKINFRTRLRQHPILFIFLAFLLFLSSLVFGLLVTSSTYSLWIRLVFFISAVGCLISFFYIVQQSRKARRYRGDQDLGASGISTLETMKIEFQAAQRSLGKLASDMGYSIRQIDEMMQTTEQLEEAAENAKNLATMSEEQATALFYKLKQERNATNLWSALFFILGVLVTLATTYRLELGDSIHRILSNMGL